MKESSSQEETDNLSRVVESPTSNRSQVTPAQRSAADLELMHSLGVTINAMIDTVSSGPTAALQRPTDEAEFRAAAAEIRASKAAVETALPLPLDSTQTFRPLTPVELADGRASRWFVIQLLLSADVIDAREVPNLGIFQEYRLYSVTAPEHGQLRHALRLGFFATEAAAEAVARYLSIYFPGPTIKRVSIAERERFADRIIMPGKDIGPSGKRAVIELNGAPPPTPATPVAPRTRPKPANKRNVTPRVGSARPLGSVASELWSLLSKFVS